MTLIKQCREVSFRGSKKRHLLMCREFWGFFRFVFFVSSYVNQLRRRESSLIACGWTLIFVGCLAANSGSSWKAVFMWKWSLLSYYSYYKAMLVSSRTTCHTWEEHTRTVLDENLWARPCVANHIAIVSWSSVSLMEKVVDLITLFQGLDLISKTTRQIVLVKRI